MHSDKLRAEHVVIAAAPVRRRACQMPAAQVGRRRHDRPGRNSWGEDVPDYGDRPAHDQADKEGEENFQKAGTEFTWLPRSHHFLYDFDSLSL